MFPFTVCIILKDRCTFPGAAMPQKHPQCNPLACNHSFIPLGFILIPLYDGLVMTSFRRHQKYSVSKKANQATLMIWPANTLYMMISLLNFQYFTHPFQLESLETFGNPGNNVSGVSECFQCFQFPRVSKGFQCVSMCFQMFPICFQMFPNVSKLF